MKFGLRYCNTGYNIDPTRAVELMQAGEEAGFESAWTVEHTVLPEGYESPYPYSADGKVAGGANDIPLPDPLIWMAYVAARTSTIKLATGILILPQHNPVITAKQIATLDLMSTGRIIIGVGVGWLAEEFDALGADFSTRAARTDEYIAAMRVLWSDEAPTFDGEFVQFKGAYCRPQPVNSAVPIVVGGHSRAAARRAGRLGDGFFPARGISEELLRLARDTCEENGRDPDALEITASLPADLKEIPHLADLGVSRILVPVAPMPDMATWIKNPDDALAWKDHLDRYRDL
ncbi:MAG: LLM class F420-dependent oxidoreductase [Pseudomonadales bacterium]|jgi:probable F420-dependent oxidoreductase|nr:LLM class F420-dependent oxidoreductase [Gammaproteobacteria bacterium]MDP6027530.1 LLM class F420-dependent oxidoreductase [Pseudomonadales bacterium]MDP7316268.1 LLM class F420-dependent oxidoreductase [Pseudomonadales bacterium]|tara:strand:- start:56 stop:925 length:870 start_codon:yes stop_codon:yes gene_type:complete